MSVFILCCVTLDLSDNLTEMRQIGLSFACVCVYGFVLVQMYLCVYSYICLRAREADD